MLLPSGVLSAIEARPASRASCRSETPPKGHELGGPAVADCDRAGLVQQQGVNVAGKLDGLAALGDDVGHEARSIPAMPMAASKAPMVVGIKQTKSAINVGMSSVRSKYRAIG